MECGDSSPLWDSRKRGGVQKSESGELSPHSKATAADRLSFERFAMMEYDLIMMSLCIFVPTAFALVLLFFPKGSEEYMRWWSLLGTAVTFVVSMILFIDYLAMLDARTEGRNVRPGISSTLVARADAISKEEEGKPRRGDDLISRVPWISQ